MGPCDEEEIRLESLLEWSVCGRLAGKEKQFCEGLIKERFSELLKCAIPSSLAE
jgi:hypothetical protein